MRTKRGGWPYSQPPNVPFEINRASPQAAGLVAWWPTVGADTVYLKDYVTPRFPITTARGASVIRDLEMGGGIRIGSSGQDRLEHPDEDALSDLSEFTLSGWFRRPNTTGTRILVCKWTSSNYEYAIRLDGNSAYLYVNVGPTAPGGENVQLTSTWNANELYFIAATYKDPDMAIYLNGVLDNSDVHSVGGSTGDTTAPINIGGRFWALAYDPFNGDLFDVRISLVAFSPTQIWQLYAEPWELYKPLVRRWVGWRSPAPPPVGGHMTLWGRYWGP